VSPGGTASGSAPTSLRSLGPDACRQLAEHLQETVAAAASSSSSGTFVARVIFHPMFSQDVAAKRLPRDRQRRVTMRERSLAAGANRRLRRDGMFQDLTSSRPPAGIRYVEKDKAAIERPSPISSTRRQSRARLRPRARECRSDARHMAAESGRANDARPPGRRTKTSGECLSWSRRGRFDEARSEGKLQAGHVPPDRLMTVDILTDISITVNGGYLSTHVADEEASRRRRTLLRR